MNDSQLIVAARRLCVMRGQDPDAFVPVASPAAPGGGFYAVSCKRVAWQVAREEIKTALQVQGAIHYGLNT